MHHFDRTRRLLKKADYDHVFEKAKKIVTPMFILLYRPNQVGNARLGLAISKKMIAKSHDRNRVKRIMRESFRTTPNLTCVDIVMLARTGLGKVDKSMLAAQLSREWQKLASV